MESVYSLPIVNRYSDPDQALAVLDRFNFIEMTSNDGHNIRILKFSSNTYIASIDFESPQTVLEKDVFIYLFNLFERGYTQYYYRRLPFGQLSEYGHENQQLGEGSYSKVYEYQTSDGKKYAIKTMGNDDDSGISSSSIRDISSLVALVYPNIIRIQDAIIEKNNTHLVMPLAQATLQITQGKSTQPIYDAIRNQTQSIVYQLVRGLAYMHMCDIWHRDIKPSNILVSTRKDNDKIIATYSDFGLSRSLVCPNPGDKYTHETYTRWYRPPEILLGKYATEKSDVWALGITIVEMINEKPLFPGDNDIDQLYRIFRLFGTPDKETWPTVEDYPEWTPNMPKWTSRWEKQSKTFSDNHPELFDLITKMLTLNPDRRITIFEALRHPYFTSIRSEIEMDPCFWGPKLIEFSCEEKLINLQEYPQLLGLDLTSRGIVTNWMFIVKEELHIPFKAYFHAVYLFDKYTSLTTVVQGEYQLYALCSLYLAELLLSKNAVDINDYLRITDHLYTHEQIVNGKHRMYQQFRCHIIISTCFDFYSAYKSMYSKEVRNLAKIILLIISTSRIPFDFSPMEVALMSYQAATRFYNTRFVHQSKLNLKEPHNLYITATVTTLETYTGIEISYYLSQKYKMTSSQLGKQIRTSVPV